MDHVWSDSECFLLDSYLARLQAGETPDRDAVVREHPELASALDCLDALEQLAPPAQKKVTRSDADSDTSPTLDWGQLPRDFGPYELIREIGRGGMGVVYEARQKGLDRSVAVKMILAGHLASPELVRRFQAEAKAAAWLAHGVKRSSSACWNRSVNAFPPLRYRA